MKTDKELMGEVVAQFKASAPHYAELLKRTQGTDVRKTYLKFLKDEIAGAFCSAHDRALEAHGRK